MIPTSTHRGVVYAKNGAAASSQPMAVSAALEILREGGSAIDAGIAASAVLAVVEPGASHLGGDAFLIVHEAKSKSNTALNGSGEAPHQATADQFPNGIDIHGFKAATVPGLVSTWFAAHEKFGKLPMARLLARAIDYAENGFAANYFFASRVVSHKTAFPATKVFETMGIQTNLAAGDIVIQSDLAWTLKQIAKNGRAAFYEGEIAEKIIAGTAGWFSDKDLANHKTRVLDPISIKYRDLVLHGQPPPSQGMIFLESLKLAEGFDLAKLSTAELTHIMVEAKKIGFADRYEVLADPELVEVAVERVLSDAHTNQRRGDINLKQANNTKTKNFTEGDDTTYFLVADADGNAVSWIQSVFHSFGSSFAVPGTGILLNNRLTGFSLDPASPNFIEPGKRPAHTLNAWLATTADGKLKYVGGTPGGNIQVQTNLQLVVNLVDLGMNVQQAAEAPRWQHLTTPGNPNIEEDFIGVLEIENRFDAQTLAELENLGHNVNPIASYGHGSAVQLLEVLANGSYAVGSDPRVDGQAAGY
jgi:gamma-glutamyltranspeptidase / glutathione hydrolase